MQIDNHSDKHIYAECLNILVAMYDRFLDYLEYIDIDFSANPDDERCPCFVFSQQELVQRLFLSHTTHSGGSSTRAKCVELGLDTEYDEITFQPVAHNDEDEQTE